MKYICLFLLLFALTSCMPGGDYFGKTETDRTHTLIINNAAEPGSIDPNLMKSDTDMFIGIQIFEGLTRRHPKTLEPLPGVAKSWEIRNGFREFVFHLRTNARWSSGRIVTAHDFVYGWTRILDPKTKSRYAYFMYPIKNAQRFNTKKIKNPKKLGIKAIDKFTLKVTLEKPTPFFLDITSFYTTLPLPIEKVKKHGNLWTRPGNIACNGPFRLTGWKMHRYVIIEKNPFYWDKKVVKLKKVIFLPIEDDGAKLNLYRTGMVDMLQQYPQELHPYMKNKKDVHISPMLGTYMYKCNTTRKPLDNVLVRRALYLAINRKDVTDKFLRQGQIPARSLTPPYLKGYIAPQAEAFNPNKARRLLAQAGYKNGRGFPVLTLLYNTLEGHKHLAEIVQKMWKNNLNIKIKLENQEWKVYQKTIENKDYQIGRMGWIGDYLDPATFLDVFMIKKGNNNTGWLDARYVSLMKKALNSVSLKVRYNLMKKAEKILLEQMPIIPLYFYVNTMAVKPYVRGIYPNLRDEHPLREVWIDKNWRKSK